MFGFLKKKLKSALGAFSKQTDEEVEEVAPSEEVKEEAAKHDASLLKVEEDAVEEVVEIRSDREEPPKPAPAEKAVKPPPKPAKPETPKIEEQVVEPPEKHIEEPESQPEKSEQEPEKPPEPEPQNETPQIEQEETETKPPEVVEKSAEDEQPKPKGLFARLGDKFTKRSLSPEKFEELFFELEMALLEGNVAVEVIEKIKEDLKAELTSGKVSRLGTQELITLQLQKSILEVLDIPTYNLAHKIQRSSKRPYVIMAIGINGSGKTTTLAKLANKFMNHDLSVVMAAGDTFRAAAIDQLAEHTKKLGVKLISQGYGADPAAVAFDAIKHAESKGIDVVMVDTAGRLHSNKNLMAELEKVARVAKPDLRLFIGESITGNDCIEQAKEFDKLIGIDAIVLSKADADEKGGTAISVSYVTKKPILYLGTGQSYGDLKPFDRHQLVESLDF